MVTEVENSGIISERMILNSLMFNPILNFPLMENGLYKMNSKKFTRQEWVKS